MAETAIRVNEEDMSRLLTERKQLQKALTSAQERCTELLKENRKLRSLTDCYREELGG